MMLFVFCCGCCGWIVVGGWWWWGGRLGGVKLDSGDSCTALLGLSRREIDRGGMGTSICAPGIRGFTHRVGGSGGL